MCKIKLTLPMPPSVNALYGNNRFGRHKTVKAKSWTSKALIALRSQKEFTISGDNWLVVDYTFYFPLYLKSKSKNTNKRKKDVFNYEKALSDFLADKIAGFKDENIKIGRVEKIDSNRNVVEIEIWEHIEEKN